MDIHQFDFIDLTCQKIIAVMMGRICSDHLTTEVIVNILKLVLVRIVIAQCGGYRFSAQGDGVS